MVLRVEPVVAALEAVAPERAAATRILLDPGGTPFDQAIARDLAGRPHLVLVCPRYEGVDDRVRSIVDLELSVGDYVVSGGDLPAMLVIDAVLRLLPGAIDPLSTEEESFVIGCSNTPSTRARRSSEVSGSPMSSLSGITGRSRAGGRSRQRRAPAGSDPTSWPLGTAGPVRSSRADILPAVPQEPTPHDRARRACPASTRK